MTTIHLSNGTIHIHITGAEGLTQATGPDDGWTVGATHGRAEVAAPWVPDADYEAFLNTYE